MIQSVVPFGDRTHNIHSSKVRKEKAKLPLTDNRRGKRVLESRLRLVKRSVGRLHGPGGVMT